MYIEGSNALKTEYSTYDAPRKTSARKSRGTEGSSKAKKRNVRRMKKRVVLAMVMVFAMAFTVLFGYATITQEYSKLSQARAELELISAKVV